jgi:regulation of enolase protein 1 (concanavalin A-like superfamily)
MLLENFTLEGTSYGQIDVGATSVRFDAAAKTDWFFPPDGGAILQNVPRLFTTIDTPAVALSAKVEVDFKSSYDAAALFVRVGEDRWAKVAFEYSPQSIPTVVSVVTRGTSDDCDGPRHPAPHVYLRAYADEATVAFHFSADGKQWRFLRWISLSRAPGQKIEVGFSGQSPTGQGCKSSLSDVKLSFDRLANLRDGT